jgi:glycosyltransferase involved in cell wall biosynthesis
LPNTFLEKIKRNFFYKTTIVNNKIEKIFTNLLNEINPDIVHFQHLINLSVQLVDIAKKRKLPVIFTLHDYWCICPNIQLLDDSYNICEGPEENAENCYNCWNKKQSEIICDYIDNRFISYISEFLTIFLKIINRKHLFNNRKKFMESLLQKVDILITPSKFTKNIIKYKTSTPILISRNGLKIEKLTIKKKERKKIIFGFIGTIERHKGIHIIIDAFSSIHDNNIRLKIYGNYNEKSKYLKKINRKINKDNRIFFMGSFEELNEPYSLIDVLIVPSIWFEVGGPTVILESFAFKTPVIASKIGCIPEFVNDEINGLLFKPGDKNDLCQKIKKIVKNPKLINLYKNNLHSPRSMEEQAKEIESIYNYMLRSKK